jgi:hypothetical protein
MREEQTKKDLLAVQISVSYKNRNTIHLGAVIEMLST